NPRRRRACPGDPEREGRAIIIGVPETTPRDGLRERPAYVRLTGIRSSSTLLAEKRAGLAALVALVRRGERRFDVSPAPVYPACLRLLPQGKVKRGARSPRHSI